MVETDSAHGGGLTWRDEMTDYTLKGMDTKRLEEAACYYAGCLSRNGNDATSEGVYRAHYATFRAELERREADKPAPEPESTMTIDAYGTKVWRNKAGQLHRTDGPAIELADGDREWWVNGERLAEAEFNRRMKPAPEAAKPADLPCGTWTVAQATEARLEARIADLAAKLRDTQATLDVIRAERDALRTKLEAGTICWAEVGKHAGAVCADNENLKQQVERLKARLPVTVDDGRDTYVLSCGEFVPCTTPAKKPAKRKAKKPAKKATQAQREKVCREFGLKQGSRVRARWSVNGAPDELPEAWTDDGICSAPNGSAHFTRTLAEFRAFVAKHFKKPAKKGRK